MEVENSCSVCIESKADKFMLRCWSCNAIACTSCQVTYGISACMACAAAFGERFYIATGHKKLVKELLEPAEEKTYWDRETGLLAATQQMVDWEAKYNALKAQLRFGYRITFPPKPQLAISSSGSTMFPCPLVECRGFVTGSSAACGSCKLRVCLKCREADSESHTCNPDTLESLKTISTDSKPCPKCCAPVFRIAGCNHMFCTNCRTHFDWISGKILQNSTNHHYINTASFASNVATTGLGASAGDGDACGGDPEINAVPVPPSSASELMRNLLWPEAQVVRNFLRDRYNHQKLLEQHDQALLKVRMQYLRKDLTEMQAKRKVWQLERAYTLKLAEARLLEEFLRVVNVYQKAIAGKVDNSDKYNFDSFRVHVDFFNSAFKDANSKLQLCADSRGKQPLLVQ